MPLRRLGGLERELAGPDPRPHRQRLNIRDGVSESFVEVGAQHLAVAVEHRFDRLAPTDT